MSTAIFDVPGLPLPVRLQRMRRARVMRLRVDHDRRLLKLTAPARLTQRHALRWAEEQKAWVEAQLAAAPDALPIADGAIIPVRGESVQIVWTGGRRGIQRHDASLLVGGPAESLERAVLRWLQEQARADLSAVTQSIAAAAEVNVRSVSIGDPVSRWGSCSSSGAIRYSWRLILAPPECLRFVVAHEVAHRLHMDHSPRFKAVEAALFGSPVAPARLLLRKLGPSLRAVGRRG